MEKNITVGNAEVGLAHDRLSAAENAASPLRSWLSVGAVTIGAFAFVTTEFLPVGLLPQIAHDLGVSAGTAGLMVTTPGVDVTLGQMLADICAIVGRDVGGAGATGRCVGRFLDLGAGHCRTAGAAATCGQGDGDDFKRRHFCHGDRRTTRHVHQWFVVVACIVHCYGHSGSLGVGGADLVIAFAAF